MNTNPRSSLCNAVRRIDPNDTQKGRLSCARPNYRTHPHRLALGLPRIPSQVDVGIGADEYRRGIASSDDVRGGAGAEGSEGGCVTGDGGGGGGGEDGGDLHDVMLGLVELKREDDKYGWANDGITTEEI